MRKSLLFSFISIVLAAIILTPVASAAGVNVVDLQEGYEKTAEASKTVSFTWVVYNNDTVPYLVEIGAELGQDASGTVPSDVHLAIDQNYSTLGSGDDRQVVVYVTADTTTASHDGLKIYVNITLTRMDDPSQTIVVTKSATVDVKAMFESTGNRIFGIWENHLPAPFNTLIWSFIFTVLLWVLIAGLIYFVVDPLVKQFTKKTKTDLDDRILAVTRMPIFLMIVVFGLVDSLGILEIPQDMHVTIMQIYSIFVAVVGAWIAYRIFDKVVIYYAEKWSKNTDTEIDDVLVPLLQKVGVLFIPIVAIVAILNVLGIDVTLLVAGMGVIGLVVAFAVQETLGNLFAGIQLLMDRPFKVGDTIELESGEICEVRKIGLRSTQVYNTTDHEMIILPNNDVVNKKVTNYSRPDMHRSMNVEIGVAYGTDLEKVKRVLMDVASNHPDVIKQEKQMPYVRVAKFNDSSVDFKLWYWVEIKKMWRVASEMKQAVYDRFYKEGIEIPFPQSVVTLKNDPPKKSE